MSSGSRLLLGLSLLVAPMAAHAQVRPSPQNTQLTMLARRAWTAVLPSQTKFAAIAPSRINHYTDRGLGVPAIRNEVEGLGLVTVEAAAKGRLLDVTTSGLDKSKALVPKAIARLP